jgi:hypothetical protein
MHNAKDTSGRGFEGPFILLGVLPAWPQELERRAHYNGPHSELARLLPIPLPLPAGATAPPPSLSTWVQQPAPRVPASLVKTAVLRGGPIGGKNAVRVLSHHPSPKLLDRLETLVGVLAKPRTAKQAAHMTGCSQPTVYALLELLRRRGFPLVYGTRGAARTFCLMPDAKAVAHA